MKKILLLESQEDLEPRRQLFLRTLLENGYQVKALMWDRSCKKPIAEEKDGIFYERVRVKAKYADIKASFRLPLLYLKMISRLKGERFDIIQCGHFALLPLAVLIAKIKKTKCVYDVCEFYNMDFFRRLPTLLKPLEKMANLIENLLVLLSNGVVTIGSYKEVLYNRYKRFNTNTEVVYNVPDLINIKPSGNKLHELRHKYNGKQIIIYSGDILKEKGAIKLLESIPIIKKEFPDTKVLFIGKFKNDFKKEFFEMIKQYHLEDNVEIIGFVAYKELISYLYIGGIGVALYQPGNRFMFSSKGNIRKVFDYMGAGLPIVGSNFKELCLVVKEENCGILVDATDPNQIAEVIIYLLKNLDVAKEMGKRGRKAVEERYNWQIESKKLLKVYNSL